jgi:hypothetical protein
MATGNLSILVPLTPEETLVGWGKYGTWLGATLVVINSIWSATRYVIHSPLYLIPILTQPLSLNISLLLQFIVVCGDHEL